VPGYVAVLIQIYVQSFYEFYMFGCPPSAKMDFDQKLKID
jgi:hypothetical protein